MKDILFIVFLALTGCANKNVQKYDAEADRASKPCVKTKKAEINLIGFSIGMNQCEIPGWVKFGEFDDLAGNVRLLGNKVKPFFSVSNGKVDGISIEVYPNQFPTLKEAYKAKYPQMDCRESIVQNGFGAKYMNESCYVFGKNEFLVLEKYGSTVERGTLVLLPKSSFQDKKSETLKKFGDQI